MTRMDIVKGFYFTKSWLELSYALKVQRGGVCARCGFTPLTKEDWALLIAHHTIELTEKNVTDPSISLNPDLIEIICIHCHNKEHRRFGYEQKVYIVWGAPLSGKSTAVKQLITPGDIVLDIDALWQALTYQPPYIKSNNCRFNVFKVRDSILDQIKTRYGQWCDAYVIGGYPDRYERERLARDLGAELIYIESTKWECLARLEKSNRPAAWRQYIEDWWYEYERYNSMPIL